MQFFFFILFCNVEEIMPSVTFFNDLTFYSSSLEFIKNQTKSEFLMELMQIKLSFEFYTT